MQNSVFYESRIQFNSSSRIRNCQCSFCREDNSVTVGRSQCQYIFFRQELFYCITGKCCTFNCSIQIKSECHCIAIVPFRCSTSVGSCFTLSIIECDSFVISYIFSICFSIITSCSQLHISPITIQEVIQLNSTQTKVCNVPSQCSICRFSSQSNRLVSQFACCFHTLRNSECFFFRKNRTIQTKSCQFQCYRNRKVTARHLSNSQLAAFNRQSVFLNLNSVGCFKNKVTVILISQSKHSTFCSRWLFKHINCCCIFCRCRAGRSNTYIAANIFRSHLISKGSSYHCSFCIFHQQRSIFNLCISLFNSIKGRFYLQSPKTIVSTGCSCLHYSVLKSSTFGQALRRSRNNNIGYFTLHIQQTV